ncbi:MAG: tetratricopeptide repeat protein, partial [Phycisphaerales bacterium]|nr:tetratricopeptide repeat protein [Phycisphaerales bacterium]
LTTVGRLDDARALFHEGLEIRERIHGPIHPDVAQSKENLSSVYRQLRDFEAAERMVRESLAILDQLPVESVKRKPMTLNGLALILDECGRREEAKRYYLEALSLIRDENDLSGATIRNNLAGLYFDSGELAKAESLFLEARDIYRRVLGDEHFHVAHALNNLGVLYTEMNRLDDAEDMQFQAYGIYRNCVGALNRHTATSLNNRGSILIDKGRYDEAGPLLAEALEIRQSVLPSTHPEIAATMNNLARIELGLGR